MSVSNLSRLTVLSLFVAICLSVAVPAGAVIQQDAGSDGSVEFEAESAEGVVTAGTGVYAGQTFQLDTSPADYSGTGLMRALPDSGSANASDLTAPYITYTINFVKTGTHYVWLRSANDGGGANSCMIGFDGAITNNNFGLTNALVWTWATDGAYSIDVPSVGEHTFIVAMREDGCGVDRVALSTSASYHPEGPAVLLPNVLALAQADAEAALTAAGFTNIIIDNTGGGAALDVGEVGKTTPGPGTVTLLTNLADPVTVQTILAVGTHFRWTGAVDNKIETEGNWQAYGDPLPTWPPTDVQMRLIKPGSYTLSSALTPRQLVPQGGVTVTILSGGVLGDSGGNNGVYADSSEGPVGRVVVEEGGIIDGGRNWMMGTRSWMSVNPGGSTDGLIDAELVVNGSFTTGNQLFLGHGSTAGSDLNSLAEIGGNGALNVKHLQANAGNAVIRFVGDADSFGVLTMTGRFTVGGSLEIDTAAYAGGAGSWDIMTFPLINETKYMLLADFVATAVVPSGWTVTTDGAKITLAFDGGAGDGDGDGGSGSDGVPVAGMPVTGAIGLGLVAAACALGGSMFLRKK